MSRLRSAQGFTLLEMVIAIAITGLVVMTAVQAYRGIVQAQERADNGGRVRSAEILLDRLERELVGAVLVVKPEEQDRLAHPWLFLGEDDATRGIDVDRLRFVTQTPARAAGSLEASGLRMVSYGVVEGKSDTLDLVRTEGAVPAGLEKQIVLRSGHVVIDGLARFDLRFRSENDGQWKDAWDSGDLATLDQLPEAVEISVRLFEEDPDGKSIEGPELVRSVPLPVRPFSLERKKEGGAEGCETGPTIRQCLESFAVELEKASADDRRLIQEKARLTGNGCWSADPRSAAHEELAALLEKLGANPDEKCR